MFAHSLSRRGSVFEWTLVGRGIVASGASMLAHLLGLLLGFCGTFLFISLDSGELDADSYTTFFVDAWPQAEVDAVGLVGFTAAALLVGFRARRARAHHAIAILALTLVIESIARGNNALSTGLIPGSGPAVAFARLAAFCAIALLFIGLDRRLTRTASVEQRPGVDPGDADGSVLIAAGRDEFFAFTPKRPLDALLENLRAGAPLAVFGRVQPGRFHVSTDQVALLVVLGFASQLLWEWLLVEPPYRFEPTGLAVHGFGLLLTIAFACLVGREEDAPDATLRLLVMPLSAIPVAWIGFALFDRTTTHSEWFDDRISDYDWGTFFAIWLAPLSIRVLQAATRRSRSHCVALGLLYAIAIHQSLDRLPSAFVFFHEPPEAPSAPAPPRLDAELVLHEQRDRLARAISALAPQRPGVTDLYVVSFGADASQKVFRIESKFVRDLFDREYGTKDRSLLLVNHRETLDSRPLASRTNLGEALLALGSIIDPQEDLVFVYLTGHGTREHDLYVRFPGLPLNSFGPKELDEMFHAAGIRSRVVIVSACYSGGFVDVLADPDTLVMSASARDRRSFGCSDDAELTDFARAYFGDALEKERDLVRAFELARAQVEQREAKRDLMQSRPQIAVGKRVARKLDRLVDATRTSL